MRGSRSGTNCSMAPCCFVTGRYFKWVRTKSQTPSSVCASFWKRSSKPPLGLYAEITRSCLTEVGFVCALKVPCPLCRAETFPTTKPASLKAVWMLFQTEELVLENSTVIHRPGLSVSYACLKQSVIKDR